jgi:hypothetical protein
MPKGSAVFHSGRVGHDPSLSALRVLVSLGEISWRYPQAGKVAL